MSAEQAFDIVRDALVKAGVSPESVSRETKLEDHVGRPAALKNFEFADFCGSIEAAAELEFDDEIARRWLTVGDVVDWLIRATASAGDDVCWAAV